MMDYRLKKQMIFEVNTTSSSLKTCSVDHSFKAKNATLGGRLRLNLSWFTVLLLAMKNHDREVFFLSPYFLPLSVENAILFPTSNLLLNVVWETYLASEELTKWKCWNFELIVRAVFACQWGDTGEGAPASWWVRLMWAARHRCHMPDGPWCLGSTTLLVPTPPIQ